MNLENSGCRQMIDEARTILYVAADFKMQPAVDHPRKSR
jgi:hypothetical protein